MQRRVFDLERYKSINQEVPKYLYDKHYVDVTDHYFKTVDVRVRLKEKPPKGDNCAFLCVYNNDKWIAVDWEKIEGEFACFTNINDSLLYNIMYYHDSKLRDCGNTFFLSSENNIRYFNPKDQERMNLRCDIDSLEHDASKSLTLYLWDHRWKVLEIKPKVAGNGKNLVTFKSIPCNGLFKVNSSRPFWISNRRIFKSEPGPPDPVHEIPTH